MSWQPPPSQFPPSFPEPSETTRSAHRRQNAAGGSAYPQAGPPPGHAYPSQSHSPGGYPAQPYSSSRPQPSHRFTDPTPTYEHASYSHPSAPPPLSGTVSHYPSYPVSASPTRYESADFSGRPPHEMQREGMMSIPVHSNNAPSMPYNTSPPNTVHPRSHSQMSGGPQPTGTYPNWNYSEVNERETGSSEFRGRASERGSEDTRNLGRRSPPYFPIGLGGTPHDRRPGKGSNSSIGSRVPDQLPCRFCRQLSPREVTERLDGFCSERHRWQWWEANQQG